MKKSLQLLAGATLLLACGIASAQGLRVGAATVDPQKAAIIRQLMEVTGSTRLSQQVLGRLLDAQKASNPDVDPEVWDRLAAKLTMDEMTERVVAIYDRHFSKEDLQAALDFYRSAAGQRMVAELPAVMNESMAAGQEWGQQKAAEVADELRREQEKKAQFN
jgi:hypothetical protein